MPNAVLRKPLLACSAVLMAGLAATAVVWLQARAVMQEAARHAFESTAAAVAHGFSKRFAEYESLLRAGATLVELRPQMSRREWARFAVRVDSQQRYPGMRALGFASQVLPQERAAFERRIQREGPDHYEVWPSTSPVGYAVPVVSSEPRADNARALGFDMASEPVRRAALELARDSGRPAITGKLNLIYDAGDQDRAGFLVYAPVYRFGARIGTVERRREAIAGYVFGGFRMREVIGPLLGEVPAALDLAVFDRAQPDAADLLFDTHALRSPQEARHAPQYTIAVPVEIGQSVWTLRFSSRVAFEAQTGSALPWVIACSGVALTLLLTALIYAIGRTRERAETIAASATRELREAQLAAERNRRFLDAILHAIPQPVYVKDEQHRWVMANEPTARLLSAPAGGIIGLRDEDLLTPEVAQAAYAEDDEVLASGRPLVREVLIQPRNGPAVWGLKSKNAVRMPDGTRYVVGITMDVTRRKEAEAAGESTRLLLDAVLNASPSPLWVKDEAGRWILINPAAARLLGGVPAMFIGKTVHDVYGPEAARSAAEQDAMALASDQVLNVEGEIAAINGEVRWGIKRKRAIALPDGRRILIGSVMDLTQQRAAQIEVERARQFLEEILDSAPQPIFVKDPEHRWVVVNKAFCALFGRTREEMLGRSDADFAAPAWAAKAAQTDDLALASSTALQWEDRTTGLNGTDRWIVRTKRAVLLRDGSRYVVGVNSDITDLKNAQEELRRHRDNLQQLVDERTRELRAAVDAAQRANQAKSEFLANMSHELRTPMHAILSFARLGERKAAAEELAAQRLAHYFRRIDQSGTRLLALVNDLLDLSRLEAGRMRYELGDHDLEALAAGVAQEIATLAHAAGVSVRVVAPLRRVTARCDALRIGQVLRNLLSNAIKFTAPGGEVVVGLAAQPPGGVRVSVTDNGVGIPQDELERIFEKFIQSSRTRSNAGGTGLGLAICREIIAAHGGQIWAESGTGAGSRFVFVLPGDSGPAAQSACGAPAAARVLDDEPEGRG